MKVQALILLLATSSAVAQGTFQNLDFEQGYTINNSVLTIPGWVASAPYVTYDSPSLSGESISIIDTNLSFFITAPFQGKYYALFVPGNSPYGTQTISLGQTGMIPSGTHSITFWGDIGGLQITFAGQSLAFSEIGTTANYNIYAADISAFAGQTGQLLFSLPAYVNPAKLDNIQFSPSSIPEPSALALSALATALLSLRLLRGSQARQ